MKMTLIQGNGASDVIGTYSPSCCWDYLAKQLKDAARIYLGNHRIDYSTMTARATDDGWRDLRIELK